MIILAQHLSSLVLSGLKTIHPWPILPQTERIKAIIMKVAATLTDPAYASHYLSRTGTILARM